MAKLTLSSQMYNLGLQFKQRLHKYFAIKHFANAYPFSLEQFLSKYSAEQTRLMSALFIALFIHLIILSIHFINNSEYKPTTTTLDVILNPIELDEKKPEKVDYLAQNFQQGGSLNEEQKKTSNTLLMQKKSIEQSNKPQKKSIEQKQQQNIKKSILSTKQDSRIKTVALQKKVNKQETQQQKQQLQQPKTLNDIYLAQLKQQIVDLEADLDSEANIYSRQSKRKYLHANTAKALDAKYIKQWTKKIERIGNLHYPEQAKTQGLSGQLILAVTINKNGKVVDIEIRKSSNYKVLDNAAIKIVKLSSPFAAIPKSVLLDNDAIVITRTWLFSQRSDGKFIMN